MGLHDPAQVDAYFGPERLQQQAEEKAITLDEITQRAAALAQSITTWPEAGMDELEQQRIQIDALLPGEGPLPERVSAFRERFIIPPDRLSAVFDAGLDASDADR